MVKWSCGHEDRIISLGGKETFTKNGIFYETIFLSICSKED